MPINKIIKSYFVFVLMMASLAIFGQTDPGQKYFVSVIHTPQPMEEEKIDPFEEQKKEIQIRKSGFQLPTAGEVFSSGSISFENDPASAYAVKGADNKKFMDIVFKANEKDLEVSSIRLKLVGAKPWAIESALLANENVKIADGVRFGEYFVFDNFDMTVPAGEEIVISLHANLNDQLETGERLRFDLESAEDLEMYENNEATQFRTLYPMKGKYVSIISYRGWLRVIQQQ